MKAYSWSIAAAAIALAISACSTNDGAEAAALELSVPNGSLTAGAAAGFSGVARDARGDVAKSDRGTGRVSAADPGAGVPAPYAFTAADAGRHTFGGMLVLKKAGARTLSASDATKASLAVWAIVAVDPAAAAEVRLTGFDPQVVANAPSTATVALFDAFG